MSGRYALFRWPQSVAALPGFPTDFAPSWNLAPGRPVLMLRQDKNDLRADAARWGLTPSWLSDLAKAPPHARVETVQDQPMFQEAFAQRRCLMPANGFYEWRGQERRKRPYWLHSGEGLLYFAGIWEPYPTLGHTYLSAAMLTLQAHYLRRPVVLDQAAVRVWLNPNSSPEQLQEVLLGAQPQLLERALSTLVNDPSLNGPECLTPA